MPELDLNGDPAAGKVIAEDRGKGNCLACHMIVGAESPGAIGPALIAMQTRYPSKEDLARQIWDATVKAPEAAMPPFGKHEILTDKDKDHGMVITLPLVINECLEANGEKPLDYAKGRPSRRT